MYAFLFVIQKLIDNESRDECNPLEKEQIRVKDRKGKEKKSERNKRKSNIMQMLREKRNTRIH